MSDGLVQRMPASSFENGAYLIPEDRYILDDGLFEYYTHPGLPGFKFIADRYGFPKQIHEQAYNWYDTHNNRYKDVTPEQRQELLDSLKADVDEVGRRQALSQEDFKPMEASGSIAEKCRCKKTCEADLMFGGNCNRNADQEDCLCTPCRGYAIMKSQKPGRKSLHCHGCDWGMGFGSYSEARAAEDIWSPKRPGEGEPDLY